MANFISPGFKGRISDREIIIKSNFCDHLERGDHILADRGFTIEDLLLPKGAQLILPPFLKGRSRFTSDEEKNSRTITRARIHVERFNQRLKLYKYIGDKIPQKKFPYINQAIFVCCCLVNLTKTFAK